MSDRFPVKKLLSRCLQRRPAARRCATRHFPLEALEQRILPDGNVQVHMSGDKLVINGDTKDNSVSILVDSGKLVVRGLSTTTINGGSADFVVNSTGTTFDGNVLIKLGAGDDTLAIGDGLTFTGQLTILDYFGDDKIGIGDASIGGLTAYTFFGNDSIRLNKTDIHGETNIVSGAGDDLIVLDQVHAFGFFRVVGGPGDDGVDTESNTFDGRFVTRLGFGDDDADFHNDTVGDAWIVRSRTGDDAVRGTGMTVSGFTLFRSRGGDDNYLLTGTNALTGRLFAWLGLGKDNLELSAGTTTTGGVKKNSVEGDQTTDSVYSSRLDGASTGLGARADALRLSVDGALSLTLDTPANTTQGNGVLLTKQSQLTLTGTTHAGATVTLDVDNDGQFDDGTAVADANGHYSLTATLVSNSVNAGTQTLKVQSSFGGSTTSKTMKVDRIVGTVVRFTTTMGNYEVELFNADAPGTVTNFLNYLSRYTDSIIHRSEKTAGNQPFVIQGGGFVSPPGVTAIATDAPITNEFKAANSNVRGTLAMALPSGNVNGGTSQWFINAGNNSSLDAGLYTVFGKVLGDGMNVVDDIHSLTSYNLIGATGETALANVPLKNYVEYTDSLAGTASVTNGQTAVVGVGTSFTTELKVGQAVKIGTVTGVVNSITDNTHFSLAVAANATLAGQTVKENALPGQASFVTLSSVATLTVT